MNTESIFEQAKKVGVFKVLSGFGVRKQYSNYECMFHNDSNPSAFIMTDGLALYCPVCGKSYDSIDIHMQLSGETDIIQACYSIIEKDRWTNTYVRKEKVEEEKDKLTISDRLKMIQDNPNTFNQYLATRGISEKVLSILDKNNIKYGIDNRGQQTLIFNNDFALYRHYKEQKNFASGEIQLVEIHNSYIPTIYITEGIFDALTVLDTPASANVICLNSIYNEKKFYELILDNYEKYKNYSFIMALDNDKVNKKNKDEFIKSEKVISNIKQFLKEKEILCRDFNLLYNSNCKDVNELRQKGLF